MNIAVFGGSFNPIHTGHAMIASQASQQPGVDEVWLMVSPQNPLKHDADLMPEEERLALARLVADECKGVRTSDFEFRLPRPSYTYNTLCRLRDAYPEHTFRLLIGSDNWNIFSRWRNSEKIISEFGVIIYPRPDAPAIPPFPENVELLNNLPLMLVSSTYIRESLKHGRDIRFLVPDAVYDRLIPETLKTIQNGRK